MNLLIKKEIRLLAPAWIAMLAILLVFPWLGKDDEWIQILTPAALFFGMIILAVDSFGREFSQGTFLPLLAQPVERRRIWRTKMAVLAAGIGVILAGFIVSTTLRYHMVRLDDQFIWQAESKLSWLEWWGCQAGYLVLVLVACSGALWTTLLIRQAAAAFWVAFLTPLIIVAALSLLIPSQLPETWHSWAWLIYALECVCLALPFVYSGIGFWLAYRLFQRAEVVGWSGGVIGFSRWRHFERAARDTTGRRRRPLLALVKKEFQLQTISLFCAATLLVLHIALILLRRAGGFSPDSFMAGVAEFFWIFWLVLPLVIGCMAVAEERKLGVTAEQFCLPVSRRLQFTVKYFPVLVSGVLLGSVVPLFLELTAMNLGDHSYLWQVFNGNIFGGNDYLHFRGPFVFCFLLGLLSLGLTLAGLYASSLARNFMQALGISVVMIVAAIFFYWPVVDCSRLAGIDLNPVITIILLVLALPPLLGWLAYGNFKHIQESRRLWYRNGFGLAGGLLLVFALSAVIYNRAWEVFEPAEPAHGPARFAPAHPPVMKSQPDSLLVRLPDGRERVAGFDNPRRLLDAGVMNNNFLPLCLGLVRALVSPLPHNLGTPQYLPGTDWASVDSFYAGFYRGRTAEGLQIIGIKNDGSLWTSARSAQGDAFSDRLEPVGTETDWAQVARSAAGVWLLKKDGTLWKWNTNNNYFNRLDFKQYPARDNFRPQQIGTATDWRFLAGNNVHSLAGKADGSLWEIGWPVWVTNKMVTVDCTPETNFARINLRFFPIGFTNPFAAVHPDGTLWLLDPKLPANLPKQYGQGTNWQAVVVSEAWMVALKTDGTLWSWRAADEGALNFSKVFGTPPVRLGIHQDWVGITGGYDGVTTLAADGSLWFWPFWPDFVTKLPKQPQYFGNVLDGQ